MTSRYICFEGADGSGKSTLLARVGEELARKGHSVYMTKEPGGCSLGAGIRALIKDPDLQAKTHPLSRRMLFEADRISHQREIEPLLAEGHFVLVDRHCPVSNTCYGLAEGTGADVIRAVEALDKERRLADLVVLVEIDRDTAWARVHHRGEAVDPAERDRSIFEAVFDQYEQMVREVKDLGALRTVSNFLIRARVVPSGDIDEMVEQVIAHFADRGLL